MSTSSSGFGKALVALDLTMMDGFILDFIAAFHQSLDMQEVLFFHSTLTYDKNKIPSEYQDTPEQNMAEIRLRLEQSIKKQDLRDLAWSVEVVECQSHTQRMIQTAIEHQMDLIVMGRKRSLKGSGITSSHIARQSPTSILFVTQSMVPSLRNVLVPTDFSGHSLLARHAAQSIQRNAKSKVSLAHIYEIPWGYTKLGKTRGEFAEIVRQNAVKDFQRFRKEHDLPDDLLCEFVEETDSRIDQTLQVALAQRTDLIVLGSRGRTNSAALIMGSFAEKMVFLDADISVLIVKENEENMGLLQALLEL